MPRSLRLRGIVRRKNVSGECISDVRADLGHTTPNPPLFFRCRGQHALGHDDSMNGCLRFANACAKTAWLGHPLAKWINLVTGSVTGSDLSKSKAVNSLS